MSINLECPLRAISLGYERENMARPQEFDFSAWAEEFGSGVPQLLFQRPGETQPYPVLLTVDGTVATWTPDATDTAITGEGKAQLSYTVDETVVKNMIFSVVINPSLGAGGEPPDPYETWLEELTELAADTQAAAIAAGESETAAGNSATAANNAKLAAQAAQTAAETAQGKAETAQQKAEGAQAAAVIAQGKAEDAASAAEGYAANAYSYMGGAADSADAASGSAAQAVNAKNAAQAAQAAIENMTASASMGNVSVGTPSVSVVKSTVGGHENLDFTFYNLRGQKGDQGSQGVQGERGPTGPSGQDGYSPTVTVTDITGGHQVTITDRDGANTFNVMDGQSPSDLDAGDVAYDDEETYPADTVGSEISTVKSAITSTSDQLVYRFGTPVPLVAETELSFSYDSTSNLYKWTGTLTGLNMATEFDNNSLSNVYAVTWDGTTTLLVMFAMSHRTTGTSYDSAIYLGNTGLLGHRDPYNSTVPYLIDKMSSQHIYTSETDATHTISIARVPVIFGPVRKPLKTYVAPGTGDFSLTLAEEADDADVYGIAIGYAARAGQAALAAGLLADASGIGSTAFGYEARAAGAAATSIGWGTRADSDYQIALGCFNVIDNADTYALIVGDGDGNNSRSNLFTVAFDGTVASKGNPLALRNEPAVTVSGTTPTITAEAGVRYVCGEVATLTVTVPATGIVDVIFQSGSTPTVLTVTPPTGMTMKWAGGFDPTTLEANTTYELNIMDGYLGVGASWT